MSKKKLPKYLVSLKSYSIFVLNISESDCSRVITRDSNRPDPGTTYSLIDSREHYSTSKILAWSYDYLISKDFKPIKEEECRKYRRLRCEFLSKKIREINNNLQDQLDSYE